MIVEQKFERLWNSTRVSCPRWNQRINYSVVITPARVSAHRSIPQSARDLFSMFPIEKIDNCFDDDGRGGIFYARNYRDDDRSRREIPTFRRRASRGSADGIIIRILLLRTPVGHSFFCRARMKHSPSFARKLHSPFSDARRALSPCVESGADTVFADGIIV